MKHIIKVFCLLSVMAVIPGSFAATSRVGIVSKASPRLPSIAGHLVVSGTQGTTTATTTTTAAYYDNAKCIEEYTDCIKDSDACGPNFEECTTTVLFHGQMAKCLSVLYQCQPNGITALFGINNISALSTGCTTNSDGDITGCAYPAAGSVLGQLISGAEITNKLNTEQCVKSYTRCLQRDNVCGNDFELCTDNKSFKKQAVLCDSTLARCQSEGKTQLFGNVTSASDLKPAADSRIDVMIKEGESLAAMNAVKTCQKVTDSCLMKACLKNPLRCVEGISLATINSADIIAGGATDSTAAVTGEDWSTEVTSGSSIQKLLKSQCLETIGSNQYCHITYRETTPTKKDLVDIDLQEEVFSEAYNARKSALNTKLQDEIKKFDTNAKDACYATIKSCAMRSCGGGLGSVCYKQARRTSLTGGGAQVNAAAMTLTDASSVTATMYTNPSTSVEVAVNGNPYNDISAGCAAIVNADANCIYAATSSEGYTYTYYGDSNDVFKVLFPQYSSNNTSDPIGAVGKLNALLATSYNDAAIENMKKQCETIAKSCVRSMCGKDYINCYRNRTDIISGKYESGTALSKSMNKMGGILDYNIVMGLCMDTVKTSSVCEEHLKVATAEWRNSADANTWDGAESVRDAWLDANKTEVTPTDTEVVVACTPSTDSKLERTAYKALEQVSLGVLDLGNEECYGREEAPRNGKCEGIIDEDGCVYDTAVTETYTEYALTNGAKSMFQKLLMDVEKEVQAKYNAKLTKEQNICYNNNSGGIKGTNDLGSTFMWVKLSGGKVPKNYAMQGLKTNQFTPSNDLYGSFCRVRVTVMSDDKDIQDQLGSEATAYFAVGDPFTCGSWISQKTLQKISDSVANRKVCEEGYGKWEKDGSCNVNGVNAKKTRMWLLSTILPAVGAGTAATALTETGALSGILGLNKDEKDSFSRYQKSCTAYAKDAIDQIDKITDSGDNAAAAAAATTNKAVSACKKLENADCPNETTESTAAKKAEIRRTAKEAQIACENAEKVTNKASDLSTGARIAIPLGTAAVAAGTGAAIVANVIKQKKEDIKNEASQQWMNEVGDHIECYVGGEQVGVYGDPISVEIN